MRLYISLWNLEQFFSQFYSGKDGSLHKGKKRNTNSTESEDIGRDIEKKLS